MVFVTHMSNVNVFLNINRFQVSRKHVKGNAYRFKSV